MKFSERIGSRVRPVILQVGTMSPELKNRLWNTIHIHIFIEMTKESGTSGRLSLSTFRHFIYRLWSDIFKEPINVLPGSIYEVVEIIHKLYGTLIWDEVYEFLEYFLTTPIASVLSKRYSLEIDLNKVLLDEQSGYRVINHIFAPITTAAEIKEVEESITNSDRVIKGAAFHLEQSLILLSQKPSPDFRNSIKESISAVESVCKYIVDDKNADLSKALKKIEDKIAIHKALKDGFQKIYAYSSDEGGIRHAMLDESQIDFEDAKYMLVSCSAFINYLFIKYGK